MTMPSLAANLTFLWTELPFLERFRAARTAGFRYVEYMFPYEHPGADLRARLEENGLRQVLFNLPAGDWTVGDRGIAADPARIAEFRAGVADALLYSKTLDVHQLNCLAGLQLLGVDPQRQWATLVENVRYAARQLRDVDRRLLVEAVNTFDVPGFLLATTEDVLRLLDEVAEPNVFMQFDAYHVQRMEGDPSTRLQPLLDRVGHVQIADHPGRHQPGTGNIDFDALFALLEQSGYPGTIGLEYIPSPNTDASLSWCGRYGFAIAERS